MSDDTGSEGNGTGQTGTGQNGPARSANPFIIPPPPPQVTSAPDAPAEAAPEPPVVDAAPYIDLPPGVIDSATFKVEPTRVARPPRPLETPQKTERSNDEITFFEAPIGAPAVPVGTVTWTLTLPDGTELELDDRRVYVGRRPSAPDGILEDSGIRLVPVVDQGKSVSKTHAAFEVRDGALFVTDLGSTNGIAIGSAGQEDELVTPGKATIVTSGRIVALGTFEILVARRK